MGVAKFGPTRRKKRTKTMALLAFSALVGAALVLAIAAGGDFSTRFRSNVELFPLLAGAWAFIVFGGMAFWLDLPRLLLAALVYAVVFSHVLPVGTATAAFVGGTVLAVPGLIMLVRFMRKYPLPAEAEAHGNG